MDPLKIYFQLNMGMFHLPGTNSSHLEVGGWKMNFFFGARLLFWQLAGAFRRERGTGAGGINI